MLLHAHAVAEDRAAGERRRRIDGEHGDLLAERAQMADDRRWSACSCRIRARRSGRRCRRRPCVARRAGRPRGRRRHRARRATAAGRSPRGRRRARPSNSSVGLRRHATSTTSSTLTTSVTPSTRSRMIRSMPAFSVCVDAGQPTHAPVSVTVTMPVLLVDVAEHDVAAVGLEGRADHLDGLEDLVTHHVDLGPFKQDRVPTMARDGQRRARDVGIPPCSPTRAAGTRSCSSSSRSPSSAPCSGSPAGPRRPGVDVRHGRCRHRRRVGGRRGRRSRGRCGRRR